MPDAHIQKVLEGDKEAYRYIIKKFQDGAYTIALSITKDEFTAKDAVQSAFIKAYFNLDNFEGRSSFKTWFHKIIVNEAFQVVRKNVSKQKLANALKQQSVKTDKNFIERKIDASHIRFYIQKALAELSDKECLALQLFYFEEYSIGEIEHITDWSVSNIKVILHRGRKNLKKLLVQKYKINQK